MSCFINIYIELSRITPKKHEKLRILDRFCYIFGLTWQNYVSRCFSSQKEWRILDERLDEVQEDTRQSLNEIKKSLTRNEQKLTEIQTRNDRFGEKLSQIETQLYKMEDRLTKIDKFELEIQKLVDLVSKLKKLG